MQYRKIKKTGDELSVLGFGAMRLPTKNGMPDEKRATKQIRYAIDHGVNFIDTALAYMNESLVGRILGDGYREKVKIATKIPAWKVDKPDELEKTIHVQLENFNTPYIDYYMLHGLTAPTWKKSLKLDALTFLDRMKAEGKIKNAGFSFHGGKDLFKEIVDAYDWDFCMIQYNYLDEEYQAGREGLEYAAAKGMGILVMEPFRGGNLAGKIPSEVQDIWDRSPIRRTPTEWALRWVLNHPGVTCVLSGMNEEEHIEENLRVSEEGLPHSLSEEELELVGEVRDKYRKLMKTGCTGCQYCMPCSAGVDIPRCLQTYDSMHIFNENKLYSQVEYALGLGILHEGQVAYASKCTKCGKCEKRCPQELPVMEILDDVSGEMEGIITKIAPVFIRVWIVLDRFMIGRRANNTQG